MDHTMPNSTTDHIDMRKDWSVIKSIIPEEIASFMDDTFNIIEIRRRIGECEGITFEVRSREQNHTIPHVHAKYGEYSISISIEDGRVLDGNLPRNLEKKAANWVISNREKLLTNWKNYAISATTSMTKSMINSDK